MQRQFLSFDKDVIVEEGSVRIQGGPNAQEGRVEIFLRGQWGTVCNSYSWDLLDAIVVCRQLGYLTAVAVTPRHAFNSGRLPVRLDSVACSGYEKTLTQCSARNSTSCYIYDYYNTYRYTFVGDAGVICSSK